MHEQEHKTWIPFITVGCSVCAALFFAGWLYASPEQVLPGEVHASAGEPVERFDKDPERVKQEYRKQVEALFTEFSASQNAWQVRDELVSLTVPPEFQALHLEFVLAMQAHIEGRTAEAQERFAETQQTYSRLNL